MRFVQDLVRIVCSAAANAVDVEAVAKDADVRNGVDAIPSPEPANVLLLLLARPECQFIRLALGIGAHTNTRSDAVVHFVFKKHISP